MKYLKSAGDQSAENYPSVNRRRLMKLFCLAGISMAFAIGACDTYKVEPPAQTKSKKESNMESIKSAQSIQNKIPPIDAATAPETETATFALG
jgi:hypothetical protein